MKTALEFLLELKAKLENIKVVSQSLDEVEIGAKAQKAGLLSVCQKYKVLSFDFVKGKFFEKRRS